MKSTFLNHKLRYYDLGKIFKVIVLIGILLYTTIPIIWVIITSLKNPVDVMSYPPKVIFKVTFDHYLGLLSGKYGNFIQYYLNSIIVAFGASLISLVSAGLLGCYLSRFSKSRLFINLIMAWVLFVYAIPPITLTIPFYNLLDSFHLINTRIGLIFAHITGTFPYAVWMLKTFFDEIPNELEEAAMIDGLTKIQAQYHIIFKLALPGFVATAIFTIIRSWNELAQAMVLTENAASRTVPVGILSFIQENMTLWGPMSAASVVAMIPVFLIALKVQKQFIKGFGFGIKE
jgi:ABC-type glycerol-3-phosphate transport system permease component